MFGTWQFGQSEQLQKAVGGLGRGGEGQVGVKFRFVVARGGKFALKALFQKSYHSTH